MKCLLFILIFVISCGKEPEQKKFSSGVGTLTNFNPIALSTDKVSLLNQVCGSFSSKLQQFTINPNQVYNFNFSTKTCGAEEFGVASVFNVKASNNAGWTFQSITDQPYIFTDVVSQNSLPFDTLCPLAQQSSDLKNQIELTGGNIVQLNIGSVVENCSADSESTCINLKYLIPEVNGLYKIVNSDTMKIRLTGLRRGFYTSRIRISQSSTCLSDQVYTEKSELNN